MPGPATDHRAIEVAVVCAKPARLPVKSIAARGGLGIETMQNGFRDGADLGRVRRIVNLRAGGAIGVGGPLIVAAVPFGMLLAVS